MQLEKFSGLEIGRLVNSRELRPKEVISYFINRIKERNPSLNAFVYLKEEDAFAEAQLLEDKIMRGEYGGPFAGVPVGLKDFLPSKKGWTHSHGGVKSIIRIDEADSMFYIAARSAGAIAVGKTNSPHFGFSGTCDNKLYGCTSNPFHLAYNSGGSSGGTAAAVADGLITFGEGGDAGGSIRIPSAWCNCFGFKASLGTIPRYCRPDGWSSTHPHCFNGAITRTVADSAVMLNYMAQYNPLDPTSLPINAGKDFLSLMEKPIKDWKIALTLDYDLYPTDTEIKNMVHNAAMRLTAAGAKIELVSFCFHHSLEDFAKTWCQSISIDTALKLAQWKKEGKDLIRDHRSELSEEFIYWNTVAAKSDIHFLRKFNEVRTDILDAYERVFQDYDIIISPVTACNPVLNQNNGNTRGPKEINGVAVEPVIGFTETFLVNFVGYPAASVPIGLNASGLPVGMQIIGKQYRDEDVLAVAHKFEAIQPWSYDIPFSRM